MVAIIIVLAFFEGSEFGGMTFGSFMLLAFRSFACAPGAMLFIGIEDRLQPRQNFLERGEAAGRALFTAWTLSADGTLFALRAFRAARTLNARLSIRASLAGNACFTGDSCLALRSGFSLRSRFALSAGLAGHTCLAARAFRAGTAGMTLRAGMSGLALWSLRP